jgi:two-component system capsular synthesis sensor histidine kinase RcsC
MDRILIVDDAKATRDALSNIFSVMGFKVDVASNGNEGLNLFSKNSFDLVITDLQMPGMDGWNVAFRIKDKSPNTPVVLITGSEKEAVMEKLKGGCVDSVLFKPFRLEDIQEMVQKMLGDRTLQRGILLPGKDRNSSSKV